MSLSRFPEVMPLAVDACIQVANQMRKVRDSFGDLQLSELERIQAGLSRAKQWSYEALVEGQKQPASAEVFMSGLGGPATLAAFQAAMVDIETKAAAWNVVLDALLGSLSASDLVVLETAGTPPLTTKMIRHKMIVPGSLVDGLRISSALADLIASFESVGAK